MTLETPPRKADYDRGLRLKLGLLEAEPASATTTPEPRVSSAPLSDRTAADVSQRAANRREVAQQDGRAADRTKSAVTASEASTNGESGDQWTALRWVWGAVGGVMLLMLIGLYFGSRRPDELIKRDSSATVSVPSVSPSAPKPMEGPNAEIKPDWKAANVGELAVLTGHTGVVMSVAFSPDGTRIASASRDHTVKLWNAKTGRETATLKGHTATVASVAFTPNGERIVSASYDNTIRLWGTGPALPKLPAKSDAAVAVPAVAAPGVRQRKPLRSPTSQVGTPDYAAEQVTLHLAAGEPAGLDEFISSRCKGLLADVRDGKATDEQLEDSQKLFTGLQPAGRPRTQDGEWFLSSRNSEGTTITFRVKKEGTAYKVLGMTTAKSSGGKKP